MMLPTESLLDYRSFDAPVSRKEKSECIECWIWFIPTVWLNIVAERTSGAYSDDYYCGLLAGYYHVSLLHGKFNNHVQYFQTLDAIEYRIVQVLRREAAKPISEGGWSPPQSIAESPPEPRLIDPLPTVVLLNFQSFDQPLSERTLQGIYDQADLDIPTWIASIVADRIHGFYSDDYYHGLLTGYCRGEEIHRAAENCGQFFYANVAVKLYLAQSIDEERGRVWWRRFLKWLI